MNARLTLLVSPTERVILGELPDGDSLIRGCASTAIPAKLLIEVDPPSTSPLLPTVTYAFTQDPERSTLGSMAGTL